MKRIHNSTIPPRIEPIQRPSTAIDRRPVKRSIITPPLNENFQIIEVPHNSKLPNRPPKKVRVNTFQNKVLRIRQPSPADHLVTSSGVGKTCAVVGNAKSIFSKPDGNQIDQCDVVCRINTDRISDSTCQGRKTDLIFVHEGTDSRIPYLSNPPYSVVNINNQATDLLDEWTTIIRQSLQEPAARPSTGFIAILFMLRLGYFISLFGFDWYATPTHYTNAYAWKNHFPEWEKERLKMILPALNIT